MGISLKCQRCKEPVSEIDFRLLAALPEYKDSDTVFIFHEQCVMSPDLEEVLAECGDLRLVRCLWAENL